MGKGESHTIRMCIDKYKFIWAEPICELGGMEGRWDVGEMEIGV